MEPGVITFSATMRSIFRCRALKTTPMPSAPQLVDHQILADRQQSGLALIDGRGLIASQLAGTDQRFGQFLGVVRRIAQAFNERREFVDRHQFERDQPLGEFINGDGHFDGLFDCGKEFSDLPPIGGMDCTKSQTAETSESGVNL